MSKGTGIGSWLKKQTKRVWNELNRSTKKVTGSTFEDSFKHYGIAGMALGMDPLQAATTGVIAQSAENAISSGANRLLEKFGDAMTPEGYAMGSAYDATGAAAQADAAGDEEANLERKRIASMMGSGRSGTQRTSSSKTGSSSATGA